MDAHRNKIVVAAFTAGLVAPAACTERTTGDAEDAPVERYVERCEDWCTPRTECGREPKTDEEFDDCVDGCMDLRFRGENAACAELAERALDECLAAHVETCENASGNPRCEEAQRPWTSCRNSPDYWFDHDCDETCPGDCCGDD